MILYYCCYYPFLFYTIKLSLSQSMSFYLLFSISLTHPTVCKGGEREETAEWCLAAWKVKPQYALKCKEEFQMLMYGKIVNAYHIHSVGYCLQLFL